jgi:YVTN family beta-propeller protein
MPRLVFLLLCASSLLAEQQVLLVLLKGANALGYYSLEGNLLGTVALRQHPHEMVLSTDRKFVYITENGAMRIEDPGKGGNSVAFVDIAARKVVDRASTGKYHRPHGISLDPVRNYLAVTAEAPDHILIFDANGGKLLRHFNTDGPTSHMVSFGPGKSGAEYAFVSNAGAGFLSAVQLTTGMVKKIPTGDRPEGSALSKDGKYLFVCNRDSNNITVVDVERQAPVGEIKTGKGPVRLAITPDNKTLLYAAMNEKAIEWADVDERRAVARLRVEGQPVSLNISADGKYAFSSVEEMDLVYVLDVPGRKLIRKFSTAKGSAPDPVMMVTIP